VQRHEWRGMSIGCCLFKEQSDVVTRLANDSTSEFSERPTIFTQLAKTPGRVRYRIWLCTRSSPRCGAMMGRCEADQPNICARLGSQPDNIHTTPVCKRLEIAWIVARMASKPANDITAWHNALQIGVRSNAQLMW
jgi:hypothetical protein